MIIAAEYSFNGGDSIQNTHPYLLQEVKDLIAGVDASHYKVKESKELTMPGKKLYSPPYLNRAFAEGFGAEGWEKKRVKCHYSTDYYRCAKMTIFRNLGYIDAGIEIVPVKSFANEMSTGVSYFEQFVWDLEARRVADIDIPVLIFGIDA